MDISRRYTRLDVNLLRAAYEQEMQRQRDRLEGTAAAAPASVFRADATASEAAATPASRSGYGYRFEGITVTIPALAWTRGEVVDDFAKARSLYLRCVIRLEAAKKRFPLDGEFLPTNRTSCSDTCTY